MKKISLVIFVSFCLCGIKVFGQRINIATADIPIITCVADVGFKYQDNQVSYSSVTWIVTGGTVQNYSGVGNMNADIRFTQNGSITVKLYNGATLVATIGPYAVQVTSIGTINSSANVVCSGTSVTLFCSDCIGTIQWYYRPVGGSTWTACGTSLGNENQPSPSLTQSTEFKASMICDTGYDSNIKTVTLYNAPTGGVINSVSNICTGNSPGQLGNGTIPTGGNLTYQWQQTINGGAWTNVSGATSVTYTPAPIGVINKTDYQFRRKTSGCNGPDVYSNIIAFSVYPVSQGGTLTTSPAGSICGMGSVTLISSARIATAVAWQSRYSDNNGSSYSSWTTISTSLVSSLNSGTLTSNGPADRIYQFKIVATNGPCASNDSNIASVTVYGMSGGTTSASVPAGIATASGTLTLTGYSGSVVRWEQSVTANVWTSISVTSATCPYTNVTQTTSYRAITKNSTCAEATSAVSVVTIYPVTVTASPQYLAYGKTSQLTATSGFDSYQWILNGADISGATTNTRNNAVIGGYTVRVTKGALTYTTTLPVTVYSLANVNKAIDKNGNLQDAIINLASTTRVLKEGVKTTNDFFSLLPQELSQTATYADGFGRPIQQIAIGQSPGMKDIVKPIAYNESGAIEKEFLPYATSSKLGYARYSAINDEANYSTSEQKNFYHDAEKVADDLQPYAQSVFANTMTGRVREQGGPGTAWQPGGGHAVKSDLVLNGTNEVRIWKQDLTTNSYYDANKLAISQMTDENGNKVKTYSDKSGKTILKRVQADASTWLDTYYVYDVYGRIICQVPPKAMAILGNGSTLDANSTSVAELIFKYTYDDRDRITQKKVPGAEVQYIVYDRFDRVILTQDGNLRASNKWSFIKYDAGNRPIITGILTDATHTDLTSMQGYVNSQFVSGAFFEVRGTTLQGYTNTAYPIVAEADILTVNYYDDYDFDYGVNHTPDYFITPGQVANQAAQGTSIGLLTCSKAKILGTASDYLINVMFYDTWQRVIQTVSNNQFRLPQVDNLTTVAYDFVGRIQSSKRSVNTGVTITIENRMTYDHAGRLLVVYQTIDGGTEQAIANYKYNEIGQVIEKNLHADANQAPLQSIDYRYNIRGWISSINNSTHKDEGTGVHSLNDDANDYFGMELFYNASDDTLSNLAYYNGNISAIKWKGPGATGFVDRSSYTYTYDKADRLTQGQFRKFSKTKQWNVEVGTLDEQTQYDENGNFWSLIRTKNNRGFSDLDVTSSPQAVDAMTYTYAKGNQLSKVEDPSNEGGFVNGTIDGADEYTYNANGALTADKNKGIDSIKYNDIGKVSRIKYTDGRVQTYRYTASGAKLGLKTYSTSGVLQVSNDYAAGLQFENGELMYFTTPEGRVVRYGASMMDDRAHCAATTGFVAQNSNISAVTQSGETYLKVVGNNAGLVSPGVYIASGVAVQASKKYILKVKGYVQQTSTYQPIFFINSNGGTISWNSAGPFLPKGLANENWMTLEFTTPSGASTIDFGVFWHNSLSIPVGTEFYLNEIELKSISNEYQYSIADHQGNTRVVFSTITPPQQVSFADMESGANTEFENYGNIYRSNLQLYDHTDNPGTTYTYSNLLNGGYNGQVGLAKSYKVYPGDKLKIEAYGKYWTPSSNSSNVTAFASAILSAFGVSAPGMGETGTVASGLNNYGTVVAGGDGPDTGGPKAFVNILLFDKDHRFLEVAYEAMDPAALEDGSNVSFDYMMKEVTIKEAGYAYLYVSNEDSRQVDVYFDDVKMTYTPTNIIQYNEHYPFGMRTAYSWDRSESGALVNKYMYNGSSEFNASGIWYETMFREYDPVLGRMNGVDVMADTYASLNPYNYSFNNPIRFNDPSGASPLYSESELLLFGTNYRGGRPVIKDTGVFGGPGGAGSVEHITPGSGGFWGDGSRFSDWSPNEGSALYRQGRAAGLIDIGGALYGFDKKGNLVRYTENLGQLGFWSTSTTWVSYNYANSLRPNNVSSRPKTNKIFRALGNGPGDPPAKEESSWLESLWNSTYVRAFIPDVYTIDLSFSAGVGRGRGATYTLNFITRGKEWGFFRTNTQQDVLGVEIGYGLNVGTMSYTRDISTLSRSTLLGPTATLSGGLGAGGNLNFGYGSWSDSSLDPLLIGASIGVGDTVGVAWVVGETKAGWWPFVDLKK